MQVLGRWIELSSKEQRRSLSRTVVAGKRSVRILLLLFSWRRRHSTSCAIHLASCTTGSVFICTHTNTHAMAGIVMERERNVTDRGSYLPGEGGGQNMQNEYQVIALGAGTAHRPSAEVTDLDDSSINDRYSIHTDEIE